MTPITIDLIGFIGVALGIAGVITCVYLSIQEQKQGK